MNSDGISPARRHQGLFRHSVAHFLAALITLIVTSGFVERTAVGKALDAGLLTLVLVLGVLAVGGRRKSFLVAGALAVPAVVGRWFNDQAPGVVPAWIGPLFGMLGVAFVSSRLFRFIFVARRVDSEVMCAGVANYLVLGLLWTLAYTVVGDVVPGAFVVSAGPAVGERIEGFNALYFSFITLSTVGYGDIVPAAPVARMLAMTEAVTGTFYLALLISRLVAMYSSEPNKE
jgi:hypothetical protein